MWDCLRGALFLVLVLGCGCRLVFPFAEGPGAADAGPGGDGPGADLPARSDAGADGPSTACPPFGHPCPSPSALALGDRHTCALLERGAQDKTTQEIWCWGDNNHGQLGQDAVWYDPGPLQVDTSPLESVRVRSIAVGHNSSCAITEAGQLGCWGTNITSQLGCEHDRDYSYQPMLIEELEGLKVNQVVAGEGNICVLASGAEGSGQVWCWGDNSYKLVSASNDAKVCSPQQIMEGTEASAITCGARHCCLIGGPSNNVFCWGDNTSGKLGKGEIGGPFVSQPVKVGTFTADEITAGESHTCALNRDSRQVWCWGSNSHGQVIDQEDQVYPSPELNPLLTGATWIAAGGHFTFAGNSTWEILSWGRNDFGQRGIQAGRGERGVQAMDSPDNTNLGRVSMGLFHSCAIGAEGSIQCWGKNLYGELGGGRSTRSAASLSNRFVDIPSPTNSLSVGAGHACAALADGELYCWGDNRLGQLGIGEPADSIMSSPGKVSTPDGSSMVALVAAGKNHTCASVEGISGETYCWGAYDAGLGGGAPDPALVGDVLYSPSSGWPVRSMDTPLFPPLLGVTAMGCGEAHTCAIAEGGVLYCWGDNSSGQLGFASDVTFWATAERNLLLFENVWDVVAGGNSTYAVVGDTEQLYSWGDNTYGQLGRDASSGKANYPLPVDISAGVTSVSTGGEHTCAVSYGALYCWGHNDRGQLGLGHTNSRSRPVQVQNLKQVTDVAVGVRHTCAVADPQNQLYCSGDNRFLQLGVITGEPWSMEFVDVPGMTDVIHVVAGDDHTCAVAGGPKQLYCWGSNNLGQLGDGGRTGGHVPVVLHLEPKL